jgi:hypothetical protein
VQSLKTNFTDEMAVRQACCAWTSRANLPTRYGGYEKKRGSVKKRWQNASVSAIPHLTVWKQVPTIRACACSRNCAVRSAASPETCSSPGG